MKLEGTVESEFLYPTLLSADLVPFGHLPFRTAVLPILWEPEGYVMLTAAEARKQGYLGLAEWLDNCEVIWSQRRGDRPKQETIYSGLDYWNKLTRQRRKQYTVLYPDVNRVMFASVLVGDDVSPARAEENAPPSRFIAENAMYYADTDDKGEAFFLASLLSSPIIDKMLQSFRRKEQGGHPHVHKKVWEFPIPCYDSSSPQHRRIALLGEESAAMVEGVLRGVTSRGDRVGLTGLRNRIRENLRDRLSEIDSIVKDVLQ